MWTFLGNKHKPLWIGYALDRKSKEVVAFNVGGRSIEMLSTIFKTVNSSALSKVYTDYLDITCRWFLVKSISEENGEQLI